MSLDDVFQAGTDAVGRDMVMRPVAPMGKQPKFSAWRTGTAVPRGTAAGASESAGFVADVLGAFGQAMAATDARSGMFAAETFEQRQQGDAASKRVREQGVDFSSEAGDLFRGVARSYRPDPVTSHVAEQLTFDASRFLSKAVGYSLPAGPVLGALGTGADEASMVADDLKAQGVDLATRTKVGAVQGTGAAVGVLVPVAGRTALQTAGLVAVGGPGTFVAQQAATRAVLDRADYSLIADQYDPLDPVGLAVSTIVPAAFGAYGLRRARSASSIPPEQVDAARVALQAQERQAGVLAEPSDIAGQARHDDAIARAEEQMARGERVEVPEIVDGPRADAVLAEFAGRIRAGLDEARAAEESPLPARAAKEPPALADMVARTPGLEELAPAIGRAAAELDGAPARPLAEVTARAATLDPEVNNLIVGLTENTTTARRQAMLDDLAQRSATKRPGATAADVTADSVEAMRSFTEPADPMQARMLELRSTQPDLQVQLDGMDAPMRLSDFLDQVKQEADADVADSSLYQLAAECAVTL